MKIFQTAVCLSAAVLSSGLLFAAPTSQPSFDTYDVLSQRNMFLRDRPRPRVYHERHEPTSRPADIDYTSPEAIERYTVLRGVVIENNELHAYVENTHTGDVRRLVPGDAIGNGHVTTIAIDAIGFESQGRLNWVEVGQNLQGATVAPVVSATTMPADTANLSVAERMKLRRLQEEHH